MDEQLAFMKLIAERLESAGNRDMKDTPKDVEARYQEMLVSLSPAQRIIMACRMFSTARTLVQAHILQENPNIEQKALREEIFMRFYGHDFNLSERRKILKHLKEISG